MAQRTSPTRKVLILLVEGLILGGIGAFLGLQDLSGKTALVVFLLLVAVVSLFTVFDLLREKKERQQ